MERQRPPRSVLNANYERFLMDNPDYVLQDGEFVGRSNGSNWGGLGQSVSQSLPHS